MCQVDEHCLSRDIYEGKNAPQGSIFVLKYIKLTHLQLFLFLPLHISHGICITLCSKSNYWQVIHIAGR